MLKKNAYIIFCLLLLIVHSQTFATSQGAAFEITPFTQYRFGGNFDDEQLSSEISLKENSGYGLLAAWQYDQHRQGELLYSRYQTQLSTKQDSLYNNQELTVSYLHIGGNLPLHQGTVPFYLSGGLGVTHISPENNRWDNETKFSISLGVNSRIQPTDAIHLYIAARAYGTFINTDSEIFCSNDNNSQGCNIKVNSEVWLQSELSTGVTFRF